MEIQIKTPRWALPLLKPNRYKGAKGGRGSGKSHFFAELLVEAFVINKDLRAVCIREIQKSLKYSAKSLIEGKIKDLGVSHLFDITLTEIKRIDGDGLIIFQGMQDHTADSIKSLEGFDIAWVEEAQSISKRSLTLLTPTIRKNGSEIWFSWNPENEDDAVETFFNSLTDDYALVHVNYDQNPFLPETLRKEMERHRLNDPDSFGWVWLGEFNKKSHAQIFAGKWVVEEFEPKHDWNGPYHGLDFGFANDQLAAVKCWENDDTLYIHKEAGGVGLELDETTGYLKSEIPGIEKHVIRADNSRPESISYLKRHGLPMITACEKGPGSVEDGIAHIRSYKKIVIHPDCEEMQKEARLYSYKIDKMTGDVLPIVVDKFNHYWDATRYAIEPLIKANEVDYDRIL